jgi:hypothetical protein
VCDGDERPSDNDQARRIATEVVWALSGRQFGVCRVDDFRPRCRAGSCRHILDTFGYADGYIDGMLARMIPVEFLTSWDLRTNYACWGQHGRAYDLGRHVRRVLEVVVDGVVLDPSTYRLDRHRWLIRTDGHMWPSCQDVWKAVTETGTWAVTFERGRPVPDVARDAAASLATEVYRARCGSGVCRLPRRASQVARKDVTIQLVDATAFLDKGRTGLVEVDLFLAAVNPKGLKRSARVGSVSQLR